MARYCDDIDIHQRILWLREDMNDLVLRQNRLYRDGNEEEADSLDDELLELQDEVAKLEMEAGNKLDDGD
jgi:hypothetical protein